MVFDNGILLVTGWAGFLKGAKVEALPHFTTLGEPFRCIWNVRLFDGKGYAVFHHEEHVCVEVSIPARIMRLIADFGVQIWDLDAV